MENTKNDSLGFFDYVGVVLKHRRLVFGTAVLMFILAFFLNLTAKTVYVSEARLWSGDAGLSAAFMESVPVIDRLIKEFDLAGNGNAEEYAAVRAWVRDIVTVEAEGNIATVKAEHTDPEFAATIANSIVSYAVEAQKSFADVFSENKREVYENEWKFFLEKQKALLKNFTNRIDGNIGFAENPFQNISDQGFTYVLSEAVPQPKKSKLFPSLFAGILGGIGGALFGILLAFAVEYFQNNKKEWEAVKEKITKYK